MCPHFLAPRRNQVLREEQRHLNKRNPTVVSLNGISRNERNTILLEVTDYALGFPENKFFRVKEFVLASLL